MATISEAIADRFIDPIDATGPEESIVWPEDLGIQSSMLGDEILIIPDMQLGDDGGVRRLVALKTDKKTLCIGETLQHFSPAETRSLNLLLLNRETPIGSRLIQEITETNKTLVSRSLKGLAQKLTTPSGVPLIRKGEGGTGYTIHPALEIVESTNPEKSVTLSVMREKLLGDFIAARTIDNSAAQTELRSYGSTVADTEGNGKYTQLTPKDIVPLFEQFDQGAIEYHQKGNMSDDAVAQGLIAWHKIFYSGLGLARSYAFSYIRRSGQEGQVDTYDEYFQIGAIALWNATLSFDKEKSSFAHYAILRISSDIGHYVTSELRHRYLSSIGMLREQDKSNAVHTPGDRAKAILAAEATSVIDPVQLSVAQMTQRSLLRRVFRHELLRPSEALVLSLAYGIHSENLDGLELDTPTGKLIYTEDLRDNSLFAQGLSNVQIAEMIGLSTSQIGRIHLQGLKKAHDIILTDLYTRADREEFGQSGVEMLFG